MYTIQFGSRAHFMSDEAADAVKSAMDAAKQFVTVPIDLSGEGTSDYEVTLNVSHIIALIRHPQRAASHDPDSAAPGDRPRLVLVG